MPLPVVIFNSSTGSDTAASGAGPATALFGTGASVNGTTAINLSADTPDLSGVATDGSAVLWVDTSSGRQFFKITAVDNGTDIVTVANAATPTESGKNWGIGGKRATFDNADSRTLFGTTGALPGWIIETETDQTVTSEINHAAAGDSTAPLITRGSSGAVKVINSSANDQIFNFSGGSYGNVVKNLKFTNSNGTKTNAQAFIGSATGKTVTCIDCIFGDATNRLNTVIDTSERTSLAFINCEILECTGAGVTSDEPSPNVTGIYVYSFFGCSIHDNDGGGVICPTVSGMSFDQCSVYANGADGIEFTNANPASVTITRCTIHGNTGDGITLSGMIGHVVIYGNSITANGGYGIRSVAATGSDRGFVDYNNFGTGATANTSGSMLNMTAGANDLAVNPSYTNAATGDFTIASTSGVAGNGFSQAIGSTTSNPDIGVSQHADPAGGGGMIVHPGMNGGLRG